MRSYIGLVQNSTRVMRRAIPAHRHPAPDHVVITCGAMGDFDTAQALGEEALHHDLPMGRRRPLQRRS